jgi:hypothetical protein
MEFYAASALGHPCGAALFCVATMLLPALFVAPVCEALSQPS